MIRASGLALLREPPALLAYLVSCVTVLGFLVGMAARARSVRSDSLSRLREIEERGTTTGSGPLKMAAIEARGDVVTWTDRVRGFMAMCFSVVLVGLVAAVMQMFFPPRRRLGDWLSVVMLVSLALQVLAISSAAAFMLFV